MVDVASLRRAIKQQNTAEAVFKDLDPEVARGFRELAVEPLAMLERGDVEGAVLHIKWLRLSNEDLQLFWALFDSTQRSSMKEIW